MSLFSDFQPLFLHFFERIVYASYKAYYLPIKQAIKLPSYK